MLALLYELFTAMRISPAFGFLGVLKSAEKIELIKQAAVISITSAISAVILSSDENGENSAIKLRFSTLVWICIASGCPALGYVLTFAVGITEASYTASALMSFFSCAALAAAVSDVAASKRKNKALGAAGSIIAEIFAVPVCILCAVLPSDYLSFAILYLPLPMALLFAFAAEMGYKNGILTQKTRIAAHLCASVAPICNAVIFRLSVVSDLFKFSFIICTALYTLLLIIDFRKSFGRKDN